MDSENRMYLTSDLMKYIHSGLENAEWKVKFIEENLSDFQYDVTDTEALTKVLELDIDWNTVSADDPELIKTISKKTGLTIPDVRQAVSIIDDASKPNTIPTIHGSSGPSWIPVWVRGSSSPEPISDRMSQMFFHCHHS